MGKQGKVSVEYPTRAGLEDEIRSLIRKSGFGDLRALAEAWHDKCDWAAFNYLSDISSNLWLLDMPRVPTCCPGEDHERDDGVLIMPGDPGGPVNYLAREIDTTP